MTIEDGRYVVYYRVSTPRQGRSGLGLDAQRDAARRYLERGGWPPLAEVIEVESGKRGSKRDERPKLQEALALCRLHHATLLVAKLDRLARNSTFLGNLLASGVDVVFCDLPQVPPGAMGTFVIQQMANVAQLEAGMISERTTAALKALKERELAADPNFKLGNDGSNLNKPEHRERIAAGRAKGAAATKAKAAARAADVLPVILAAQAEGAASLRAIAAQLNARRIPTARGREWSAVQVRRVLAAA